MWYDGVAFFGFADHKLPRVMGKKPGYFDKYTSVKRILMYVIGISIIAYVLTSQLEKYFHLHLKNMETRLTVDYKYEYNIT